jgi:hypothetical protein
LRRLLRRVVGNHLLLDVMERPHEGRLLACSERMRALPGLNFLEAHRRLAQRKRLRLW